MFREMRRKKQILTEEETIILKVRACANYNDTKWKPTISWLRIFSLLKLNRFL